MEATLPTDTPTSATVDEEEDPLIKALPPATDYMTYLTILEYQLTPARLPILHDLLQNEQLTTNIGWDLLHLLLPLLPASEQCLQVVARLGNPREVILKVTESLEEISRNAAEEEAAELDEELEDTIGGADEEFDETDLPASELKMVDVGRANSKAELEESIKGEAQSSNDGKDRASQLPLPALQFNCLLSMLSVLHPRIRTQYPSRFLATSLQATLAAYSYVFSAATTAAALEFARAVSGRKRPTLPPRLSSKAVTKLSTDEAAGDPEAQAELPAPQESAMQQRLLQSFLTYVLEEYVDSFAQGDLPGMGWTGRLQEKMGSAKLVPGRKTDTERFSEEAGLKERDLIVGQIMALCRDLHVDSNELLDSLTKPSKEEVEEDDSSDTLPSHPNQIPLSQTGSLYLLTSRIFSSIAFQTGPTQSSIPPIPIFPTHASLLTTFIGASTISSIGSETPAIIDAILMLGFLALHNDTIGTPETHDNFTQYLQILSALSANTPDPRLRYDSHRLTSAVLHSHSSPSVRLEFIRDTLQHCPFDNLKESAVGWLKTEVLASAADVPVPEHHTDADSTADTAQLKDQSPSLSIFLHPSTLQSLLRLLYPSLRPTLLETPLPLAWSSLQRNLNFHLAALNLLYLLLSSSVLSATLNVVALYRQANIQTEFIDPLKEACELFRGFLKGEWGEGVLPGTEEEDVGANRGLGELEILEERALRVEEAVNGAE